MPPPAYHQYSATLGAEISVETELYLGLNVRGYRAWSASWQDGKPVLRPVYRGRTTPWRPGINIATCYPGRAHNDDHTQTHPEGVPGKQCDCGYYGYYRPSNHAFVERHGNGLIRSPYAPRLVTGAIQAAGTIVIGERGFRASKAVVTALAPPKYTDPVVKKLGNPASYSKFGNFTELMLYQQTYHEGLCSCVWCLRDRGEPAAPTLKQLAQYYGVPWYESFDSMASAMPPTHEENTAPPQSPFFPHLNPNTFPITFAASAYGTPLQQIFSSQIIPLLSRAAPTFSAPLQPAFTGSSSGVVRKWWRWVLTGNRSDKD